jgi:hypothetical protein
MTEMAVPRQLTSADPLFALRVDNNVSTSDSWNYPLPHDVRESQSLAQEGDRWCDRAHARRSGTWQCSPIS